MHDRDDKRARALIRVQILETLDAASEIHGAAAARQIARALVLSGTSVTRVGLRHLVPNKSLLALDLELCDGVTDDACDALGEMTQLRSLVLKLTRLQKLSSLEVLNLYGNSVKDTGLARLQSLLNLRELNLSLMAITDVGLKNLRPLSKLERLELLYDHHTGKMPMLRLETRPSRNKAY